MHAQCNRSVLYSSHTHTHTHTHTHFYTHTRPQDPGSKDTPLHVAARRGDAALVAALLPAVKKHYARNGGERGGARELVGR